MPNKCSFELVIYKWIDEINSLFIPNSEDNLVISVYTPNHGEDVTNKNMNCIYCKNPIAEKNSSEEHVFPQSFGCPDSWTMDCVCTECNTSFGRSIERFLAGDSLEGLWRLQKIGSRSGKPIRQIGLRINIPNEDKYGDFNGVIVYFDFSKKDSLILPSQIVLKDDQGNKKYFLLDDVEKEEVKN